MLVGVVSDTHGYFNPRVAELLQGVDHIFHAGDIGDAGIIDQLSSIASVTAVRGNNDNVGPSSLYPEEVTLEIGARTVYITHHVKVPKTPGEAAHQRYTDAGIDVVVYGHSHIGFQKTSGSVLFFNPGPAGQPSSSLFLPWEGWKSRQMRLLEPSYRCRPVIPCMHAWFPLRPLCH